MTTNGSAVPPAVAALALALVSMLGLAPATDAQTGGEIMQTQHDRHRVHDEEEVQLMKLVNKHGDVKDRRIVRYALTGADDLSKLLVRFRSPRDVENTALLTWEAKDGNDDQWLYLPAIKKPKRIASSSKKNRFMGTDFSFEDLRPENLSLHNYTLIGSETIDGQDCFVIEAVPATERQASDSGYSKRKLWIRKDNYYTVKREYLDKKGRLEKVEAERKLINVKGTVWRANEVEMADVQAGSKTIVTVERRAIDAGLKETAFTEAALTREGP
jgi:hypothetical protein